MGINIYLFVSAYISLQTSPTNFYLRVIVKVFEILLFIFINTLMLLAIDLDQPFLDVIFFILIYYRYRSFIDYRFSSIINLIFQVVNYHHVLADSVAILLGECAYKSFLRLKRKKNVLAGENIRIKELFTKIIWRLKKYIPKGRYVFSWGGEGGEGWGILVFFPKESDGPPSCFD